MLRDSPVRAFTAGSLRIVVAMLGPLWNWKSAKTRGTLSTTTNVTVSVSKGKVLQELVLLLQQNITRNSFVTLA